MAAQYASRFPGGLSGWGGDGTYGFNRLRPIARTLGGRCLTRPRFLFESSPLPVACRLLFFASMKTFVAALSLVALLVPASAFAQPVDGSSCPPPSDPLSALCRSLSDVFDTVPVEADRCVNTPIARSNPAHFKGTFSMEGPYTIKSSALTDKYRGVKIGNFGTTDVQLPTGGSNNVRDMHYKLEDGKVGLRPIPVSDTGKVTAPDGTQVDGNVVMDDFLREKMGLGKSDPIFAFIAYLHPEEHNGTLSQLAKEMVKTEGGQTHLGAYIGKGATRNSPETYHNKVWGNAGYPATVQILSMKDTSQKTLNQNAVNALEILNKGVVFPSDYKNDVYKTVNLKETLSFYKGWIEDEARLRNDPAWATYCAEHQTIVANIALNVPHNEAAFQKIWGATEGAELFAKAKAKYRAATGKELKETDFEPLYEKDGIADPKNEAAIGKGLAWAPQTTADIVLNFTETYASWPDVGAPASAAMVLGFKDTVKERMGIDDATYMNLALPLINKMVMSEALTQDFRTVPFEAYAQKKTAELYVAVGGKPTDFAPGGTIDPQLLGLAKAMTTGLVGQAPRIVANSGLCKEEAWAWMRKAIAPELAAARATAVSDPSKVQFNSPPAVTHRVASGMHPSNPNISITEVATAMDGAELELRAPATPAPAGPNG